MNRFDVRLVRCRVLSPSVRELILERTDGAAMDFAPGQWVNLVLPAPAAAVAQDAGASSGQPALTPPVEIRRAYSIASAPDGSARFELAVTKVEGGPGSTSLHGLEEGAVVQAEGPQGFFTRPEPAPSLFVATGTGITPLRSMIRAALAAREGEPLVLLFGVRHEEDILYRDEWAAFARDHANFSVHYTLSRPSAAWPGRSGYVQEHVPELWAKLGQSAQAHGEANGPHAYICGLQRMVSGVRELLRKQLGAAREQVHSERFD